MKARLVLEAARRKLVELDWIQGSYQRALGKQLHFQGPVTQFWDEKLGKYVDIPIAKTDAVCAMGAVELALSNKVDLGETDHKAYMDLDIYAEVRDLLVESIDSSTLPAFDTLDPIDQKYYREDYDEYVKDVISFGKREPITFEAWADERIVDDFGLTSDGVEDWNDQTGRTKEEVIAAFDRAIALARFRETQVPIAV